MDILVVGGTKFAGVHLVNELLKAGHTVTIATRGKAADTFGDTVSRITIERTCAESIKKALGDKVFDVVYDSQAYSSNEVKYLLDTVTCKKYIAVSTVSVYAPNFKMNLKESDFDPKTHPLKWCNRDDFAYDEIKRQMECAMFQAYSHIPSIAVRLPLIIGTDDYTERLYFYVKNMINAQPMHAGNPYVSLDFIMSHDAGKFLAWLVDVNFCGSINAANCGSATMSEVMKYVTTKTGVQLIASQDGVAAPFADFPDYGLDLSLSEKMGYKFPCLAPQLYPLLDEYIDAASAGS